jgi:hypothetical protein
MRRSLFAWLVRRPREGTGSTAGAPGRSSLEAGDEAITAALQARTLRRGRVRMEDDSTEMIRRSAPTRGSD